METGVGLEEFTYEFPEIKDQISLNYGDSTGLTACGDRLYEVIDGEEFLKISDTERNLVLQTDNPGYAGSHTPKMKISLKDWTDINLEIDI